jgi:small conductance mechanosensitive channel
MEKYVDKITNIGIDFGLKLLAGLVILIIGSKIINVLVKFLKKDHKHSKIDASAKSFLISFVNVALKVLLFITVLGILGVPMTSLITILGSAAVAVGLALQGGLSNLAGGLLLLIFKPFKVGDYIDVMGHEGTVKAISLFYTTMCTIDNRVIQIPNGGLSNSAITNYSAMKTRMINQIISVSYNSDIEKVKKVINDVIIKLDYVLKEEPIMIRLKTHNSSSLDFTVRFWVETPNYWPCYFDFMENVKNEFNKQKIEIPYQQMDVHITK